MTSRKLAITQLALIVAQFFILLILVFVILKSSIEENIMGLIAASGALLIFIMPISIAIAVIGIIQIIFGNKEKVPVLLASGICAIVGVIPFIGSASRIVALILNIIGVVITKNQ